MSKSNRRHTESRGLSLGKEDWRRLDELARRQNIRTTELVRQVVRGTLLAPAQREVGE